MAKPSKYVCSECGHDFNCGDHEYGFHVCPQCKTSYILHAERGWKQSNPVQLVQRRIIGEVAGPVMVNVDMRRPIVDAFPKIKTSSGELIDDPDMVQCSFCENVIPLKKATFGKGPMRDIRIEEVVKVGDEISIQVRWVKWSTSQAACPGCCLLILPKGGERKTKRGGCVEDTRRTVVPETKG